MAKRLVLTAAALLTLATPLATAPVSPAAADPSDVKTLSVNLAATDTGWFNIDHFLVTD